MKNLTTAIYQILESIKTKNIKPVINWSTNTTTEDSIASDESTENDNPNNENVIPNYKVNKE